MPSTTKIICLHPKSPTRKGLICVKLRAQISHAWAPLTFMCFFTLSCLSSFPLFHRFDLIKSASGAGGSWVYSHTGEAVHIKKNKNKNIKKRSFYIVFSVLRIRIRIRIRIHRIHVFLGLQDPDPDPPVRGMDPDPDPSIIMQK